jgi:hypothetical protein
MPFNLPFLCHPREVFNMQIKYSRGKSALFCQVLHNTDHQIITLTLDNDSVLQ